MANATITIDNIMKKTGPQLTTTHTIYSTDEWELWDSYVIIYVLHNNLMHNNIEYLKSTTYIEQKNHEIHVYEKPYRCGLTLEKLSQKDIWTVVKKKIISKYRVQHINSISESYNSVPVIYMGPQGVHFIFNIIDIRQLMQMHAFTMANNKCRQLNQPCISAEVIENVLLSFFNLIKNDNDNPLNFKCDINFELPTVVSKYQIKKLFELGFVQMILNICGDNYGTQFEDFIILSDESFDNEILMQKRFGSKAEMHSFIKRTKLWFYENAFK